MSCSCSLKEARSREVFLKSGAAGLPAVVQALASAGRVTGLIPVGVTIYSRIYKALSITRTMNKQAGNALQKILIHKFLK
jgi:6,7-dimethyl-8-ribityllumazine synthase